MSQPHEPKRGGFLGARCLPFCVHTEVRAQPSPLDRNGLPTQEQSCPSLVSTTSNKRKLARTTATTTTNSKRCSPTSPPPRLSPPRFPWIGSAVKNLSKNAVQRSEQGRVPRATRLVEAGGGGGKVFPGNAPTVTPVVKEGILFGSGGRGRRSSSDTGGTAAITSLPNVRVAGDAAVGGRGTDGARKEVLPPQDRLDETLEQHGESDRSEGGDQRAGAFAMIASNRSTGS